MIELPRAQRGRGVLDALGSVCPDWSRGRMHRIVREMGNLRKFRRFHDLAMTRWWAGLSLSSAPNCRNLRKFRRFRQLGSENHCDACCPSVISFPCSPYQAISVDCLGSKRCWTGIAFSTIGPCIDSWRRPVEPPPPAPVSSPPAHTRSARQRRAPAYRSRWQT